MKCFFVSVAATLIFSASLSAGQTLPVENFDTESPAWISQADAPAGAKLEFVEDEGRSAIRFKGTFFPGDGEPHGLNAIQSKEFLSGLTVPEGKIIVVTVEAKASEAGRRLRLLIRDARSQNFVVSSLDLDTSWSELRYTIDPKEMKMALPVQLFRLAFETARRDEMGTPDESVSIDKITVSVE
ncbi:hypothetical protein TSACC_2591 [Terrimicrobium sacchariphilum]|uniref:Carbohydrate binding domain-containing protein n=1 Tax=Terrimicrobium sacchariphilum TaxID=690879 RepID=A0A146G411_TERSA|nr:hypothetical protein [Terrimicrobium sacchariphilum]GAT32193.1 hypothetical protein TSACC_2591 [Terrimicrobium sacchariphilum]